MELSRTSHQALEVFWLNITQSHASGGRVSTLRSDIRISEKNWLRPRCSVMSQNLTSHIQTDRKWRHTKKSLQHAGPRQTKGVPVRASPARAKRRGACLWAIGGSPSSVQVRLAHPQAQRFIASGTTVHQEAVAKTLAASEKKKWAPAPHGTPAHSDGCSTVLADMPCDFRPHLRKNKNTKLRTQ